MDYAKKGRPLTCDCCGETKPTMQGFKVDPSLERLFGPSERVLCSECLWRRRELLTDD